MRSKAASRANSFQEKKRPSSVSTHTAPHYITHISETLNSEKVIAKSRTYSKPRKQELQDGKGVIVKLKEYECVEVKHHSNVGRTIREWQEKGWRLHIYQATGTVGMATAFVNHYLLFEKGE